MDNFSNVNEVKKEMLFFDKQEFERFISVEEDIVYKNFWNILYYCGLRLGEAQSLTWNDIDLNKNTISINKSVITRIKGHKYIITTPKTKSSIRTLPISKNISKSLKNLLKYYQSVDGFNYDWFVFGGYKILPSTTITKHKDINCEKANIKRIRLHDFRHSCASLLINNGANITLVAKYLGHSKIDQTLNTYSHLYKNQLNEIVELIERS